MLVPGSARGAARRLLAVFPHPDDEAYGCAGALARAGADPEAAAAVLTLTDGEASSVLAATGLSREEIAALRRARMQAVQRQLALDALAMPGLPDGRLARLDLHALAAPVEAALAALEPHVVIAHDPRGVNGHADHIAAHFAVRLALRTRPHVRLAMVAYPSAVAESARPRLLFATKDEELDVRLALTETEIEAKEACLRLHDGLVTLRPDGPDGALRRPPVEHYDLLGEAFSPLLDDLFRALPETRAT